MAGKAEIMQRWGAQLSKRGFLQGCARLGVMAQLNRDLVCLYLQGSRPWGCGPAENVQEEMVNICESPALTACLREILQV
jgi:hypothetical protein